LPASRKNYAAIKSILKAVGDDIPVQLGGGIRDLDTIEKYIDGGLRYVIIGTAAVKNPGFLKDACTAFGGHIIVGLDAKDGKVATDGWSKLTGHEVVDLAQEVRGLGRRIHHLHRHRPRRHALGHQHRSHGASWPRR
jgi:phosphoribosylformimino-5-aminoimidazole carboxamide ribotide isomerase